MTTLIVIGICIPIARSIAEQLQAESDSWVEVWLKGAAISAAISLFAFFMYGQPSCDEYADGGGCLSYADNAKEWSFNAAATGAWNVFWILTTAGSIALLWLKKNVLDKEGGSPFKQNIAYMAAKAASDKKSFQDLIQILCTNITVGNHTSGEFKSDFERMNKIAQKALVLVKKKPFKSEREEFMTIFAYHMIILRQMNVNTKGTIFED